MRRIAALLGTLLTGAAAAGTPGSTDLALDIVKLDPPSGSTLEAGRYVTATIRWRYSRPAAPIRVWLKPDDADADRGSYVADDGRVRPGEGTGERSASLDVPGHVTALLLVAKDAASREIYRRRISVDYTFVASTSADALRRDGEGSRITEVSLDPPSPARLAPGALVRVRIGYDAKSAHSVGPSVEPVTDCPMSYRGYDLVDGRGTKEQWFKVDAPCVVRQLRVRLVNAGKAVVDERLVDVDLRYQR
jgi:hypothetical protein